MSLLTKIGWGFWSSSDLIQFVEFWKLGQASSAEADVRAYYECHLIQFVSKWSGMNIDQNAYTECNRLAICSGRHRPALNHSLVRSIEQEICSTNCRQREKDQDHRNLGSVTLRNRSVRPLFSSAAIHSCRLRARCRCRIVFQLMLLVQLLRQSHSVLPSPIHINHHHDRHR